MYKSLSDLAGSPLLNGLDRSSRHVCSSSTCQFCLSVYQFHFWHSRSWPNLTSILLSYHFQFSPDWLSIKEVPCHPVSISFGYKCGFSSLWQSTIFAPMLQIRSFQVPGSSLFCHKQVSSSSLGLHFYHPENSVSACMQYWLGIIEDSSHWNYASPFPMSFCDSMFGMEMLISRLPFFSLFVDNVHWYLLFADLLFPVLFSFLMLIIVFISFFEL